MNSWYLGPSDSHKQDLGETNNHENVTNNQDVTNKQLNVSNKDNVVTKKQEDDETKKHQDETKKQQNVTNKFQDVSNKHQDVPNKHKYVINKHEDETNKHQDETNKHQDETNKHQDETNKHQDETNKQQDVDIKHQDVYIKHQDVYIKHQDVYIKHQDIAYKDQDVTNKHQKVTNKHQNVTNKNQDVTNKHQDVAIPLHPSTLPASAPSLPPSYLPGFGEHTEDRLTDQTDGFFKDNGLIPFDHDQQHQYTFSADHQQAFTPSLHNDALDDEEDVRFYARKLHEEERQVRRKARGLRKIQTLHDEWSPQTDMQSNYGQLQSNREKYHSNGLQCQLIQAEHLKHQPLHNQHHLHQEQHYSQAEPQMLPRDKKPASSRRRQRYNKEKVSYEGFSIIGGYWSRRNFHAVCFSGFSAMLDLYMGGGQILNYHIFL